MCVNKSRCNFNNLRIVLDECGNHKVIGDVGVGKNGIFVTASNRVRVKKGVS